MHIKIYKIGKKELIYECNVRSLYDSKFYFRNIPTLSAKRCREILNIISPHFKIHSESVVIEEVETGYTGVQNIYRNGTILNF